MMAEQNAFATVTEGLKTTAAAAAFVENVSFADIPTEAVRIGTRCLLDGLGLFVAGSEEHSVRLAYRGSGADRRPAGCAFAGARQ